ncbi:NACHT domain-containing protein [Paractinoplanes toevensis]|uniref:NACHT N-terminal Helical domain-containing protein n=1 Tax=Paractinoplanes toevensis TaxID=571911 RepID=A0A919TGY3_9ACTN|nr:ATP-binding protein [Actinoplanes toevensis]GIM95355.1 hypothetical protein Ato02nite_071480 [Actinoplanes toevensis]
MRSRGLSFADAVRLLDGESDLVDRLGSLAGLAAGAVTVVSVGTVDFFALRDQVVRWGHQAVAAWRSKTQDLNRFDRTDRLVAAHTVIVIVSFYEALDAWLAERGLDLDEARLSAEEMTVLATGSHAALVSGVLDGCPPYPEPAVPIEDVERELHDYYWQVAGRVITFLTGLSAFTDRLHDNQATTALGQAAIDRYRASFRRLAAEIPEFRLWTAMTDARATRELVRDAIRALADHRPPEDEVPAGLVRRYAAWLGKPILSSADGAGDLVLPTLREAYQEPAGLFARASPSSLPATESWWAARGRPVADVQDFLFAALTAPGATDRPIVVLGHPGSGKSVLTRVLAARLSGAGFLPVRVELRNVRADSPVQRQIEEGLYLLLGESVRWPELVRRSEGALPVVIMDGFDELLQATGQNWADYLEQLQEFQEREAELGRPLTVVVTSRTVVADRARFPEDTTVVRLSPFSDDHVRAWLDIWNAANAPGLAARGLRPLPPEVALTHRELASQPLLLLMLALYDGRENQLQRHQDSLDRVGLYERLFGDFFDREVDKLGGGLSPDQWDAEVAAEWRRLSAVAVAMHNRGRDVLLDDELETDMRHLLSAEDRAPRPASARPLTVAQLLVGRFFFVHESRASQDTGSARRSFEFLHATFGEFLSARLIVAALVDLAEDRAQLRRRPGAALDAGFFYALTSFTTLTRRAPLWEFCQGMLAALDAPARQRCRDLILELLPEAGYPHPRWTLAEYEPERRTLAQRQAAFSANLVSLAVLLSDGPIDVTDLVGEPVVINWRCLALLWMSQLEPEDARRLWQSFRVEWKLTADPTRLSIRVEDGTDIAVMPSLPWPPEERPASREDASWYWDATVAADSDTGRQLRKSAFVQTGFDNRELMYVLIPFWREFGDITYLADRAKAASNAWLFLELPLGTYTGETATGRTNIYVEALSQRHGRRLRRIALEQFARECREHGRDLLDLLTDRGLLRSILEAVGPSAFVDENALVDEIYELVGAYAPTAADGP